MATLQKIRDKSGLLIVVLGVALLAFVLGDLLSSGGTLFNRFQNKAFIVDGETVSPQDYQRRLNEMVSFQEAMSGGRSLNEEMKAQVGEFVYDQMVKEIALDKQAELLGLSVTKEEINDMVNGENISPILAQIFGNPQTGQVDREQILGFISMAQRDVHSVPEEQQGQLLALQAQWAMIKNMMKYNRLEEKYNTLMASAVSANDIETKANFEDTKYNSNIAYVVERYSTMPDSAVTVSNNEIEKLYNERKSNFKTYNDARKLSYVVKEIVPSEEDFNEVEKEINGVYDKMITTTNPALLVADYSDSPYVDIYLSEASLNPEEKNFVKDATVGDVKTPFRDNDVYRLYKLVDKIQAPDSVKLQMIVLPEGEDKVAAGNKADSIIGVIKGGKAFADVANELNPQSNGGEVGWVTEPMLATANDELKEKAFNTATGDIIKLNYSGIIQILRVEEKTKPVAKYKIATVQMPVAISDKTQNAVDNELGQFVAENGTADKFIKAAQEKGYDLIPDVVVNPSDLGLPQVSDTRQVIRWAFEEKVGSVKKFDMISDKSNVRVIALLQQEIKEGYIPMSEISPMLKAELLRDKKAEKMIADLKTKNLSSLDSYAQALNTSVDTVRFVNFATPSLSGGLGNEPIMNVYSKSGEINKVAGPLKGNSGVYVLAVQSRNEQNTTYNPVFSKQYLGSMYSRRFNSQIWMSVLKEKLGVEDNRIRFF